MSTSYTPVLKNDQPVVLGEGAFGKVTLVQDPSGTQYAYKTCTYLKYMYNTFMEAAFMKKLQGCPEIVQLVEAVPNGTGMDLVLELCDGTLLDLLDESMGDGLSEDIVLDMIDDVSKGLAFMRTKKLSHCDLKMENIMYKYAGTNHSKSGYRFLIGDFGNVQEGDKLSFFHRIQTNHYRSGENLMKQRDISTCDMASLACIIYECITTQYLVEGSDSDEPAQLEMQMDAIGFDLMKEWSLDHSEQAFLVADELYRSGRIRAEGCIERRESILTECYELYGYKRGKQMTHLIQRMLFPIPMLRIYPDEVGDHAVFQEETSPEAVVDSENEEEDEEEEEENDPMFGVKQLTKSLGLCFEDLMQIHPCQLIHV
jgi:serine/threonine protein kinase